MAEDTSLDYQPHPMDTSHITLSEELRDVMELLARNTHEVWASHRLAEGWQYGPARNETRKEHPGLVPYDHLTEGERDYDRNTAMQTLKVILALGFRIEKQREIEADHAVVTETGERR